MVATHCEHCSVWKAYHPLSWLDTVTWRDFCWFNCVQIKFKLNIRNTSNQKYEEKQQRCWRPWSKHSVMSIVKIHKSKQDEEWKDVNQGGHLRDFKLCICLKGVGISSKITSSASCLCKLQLDCRRLQELTPYVHCMAPADGLYGVQVLMSLLHRRQSLIIMGESPFTSLSLPHPYLFPLSPVVLSPSYSSHHSPPLPSPASGEFRIVDKILVRSRDLLQLTKRD